MASDFPTAEQQAAIIDRCVTLMTAMPGYAGISAVAADVHSMLSAIAELRAERDRLREAAKPFVAYAAAVGDGWPNYTGASMLFIKPDGTMEHDPRITLGDCRRIAEVVKESAGPKVEG